MTAIGEWTQMRASRLVVSAAIFAFGVPLAACAQSDDDALQGPQGSYGVLQGAPPPGYPAPGYPQPEYPPQAYSQTGYPPPGYPAPGYAPSGYAPPGFAPPGYAPPGYAPPGYPAQYSGRPGYPGYGGPPRGYDRDNRDSGRSDDRRDDHIRERQESYNHAVLQIQQQRNQRVSALQQQFNQGRLSRPQMDAEIAQIDRQTNEAIGQQQRALPR